MAKKQQSDFLADQGIDLEPLGEMTDTPEVPDAPAPGKAKKSPEKSDPSNRIKDLQSTNDKLRAEINELKKLEPLGRIMSERPDLVAEVSKRLEAERKPQPPKRPERPIRPRDFDEAASYTDPESDSYKFRRMEEEYKEQLLEYQDKRITFQEEQFNQLRREAAEKEERTALERQMREKLATAGIMGRDADSFMQTWFKDGPQFDQMTEFFKFSKGLGEHRRNRPREDFYPPVALSPGMTEQVMEDSEVFSNSLLTENTKAPKKFT